MYNKDQISNTNFRILRNIVDNHILPIWINIYANRTKKLDLIININDDSS